MQISERKFEYQKRDKKKKKVIFIVNIKQIELICILKTMNIHCLYSEISGYRNNRNHSP